MSDESIISFLLKEVNADSFYLKIASDITNGILKPHSFISVTPQIPVKWKDSSNAKFRIYFDQCLNFIGSSKTSLLP